LEVNKGKTISESQNVITGWSKKDVIIFGKEAFCIEKKTSDFLGQ